MIENKDFLKALKHIVIKRRTLYNNRFPYNSGFIWASGYLSFDCIGLIKALINSQCEIAYKTKPAGYSVPVGKVIPDTSELGILELCESVKWNDFNLSKMAAGEYLYMSGHAGLYVADLFGKDSNVNVVECTTGWGCNGVVASWIDPDGTRRDMKNGTPCGKWEAHGKLKRYISYKEEKKKSITTIAKEVIDGKWGVYPERKQRLEKAGYDYDKVQNKVNELLHR